MHTYPRQRMNLLCGKQLPTGKRVNFTGETSLLVLRTPRLKRLVSAKGIKRTALCVARGVLRKRKLKFVGSIVLLVSCKKIVR